MEGTYGVYVGETMCGKVQVQKEGLYYRFFCRCKPAGEQVCKLRVQFPNSEVNLGVLIPEGDGFGLSTRIPAKRFQGIPVRFVLTPVHDIPEGKFIPITPEEPFAYIERLKEAYLIKKGPNLGVWI